MNYMVEFIDVNTFSLNLIFYEDPNIIKLSENEKVMMVYNLTLKTKTYFLSELTNGNFN